MAEAIVPFSTRLSPILHNKLIKLTEKRGVTIRFLTEEILGEYFAAIDKRASEAASSGASTTVTS